MAWKIDFNSDAERDLDKLDPQIARRVRNFLSRLVARSEGPRSIGMALKGSRRLWRYRVGDYRIVAKIQDDRLIVLVVRIVHRSDVYRRFRN